MKKINIAILGATGTVGQRFIDMLIDHPFFNIKALLASEGSAGKKYEEACNWLVTPNMPSQVRDQIIKSCNPGEIKDDDIEIVFSALPGSIAKTSEPEFAEAGYKVFSNASSFRMTEDVPLAITEVNAQSMIDLTERQQKERGWKGFIVTNPNCSTIVLCLPLKAIYDAFGVNQLIVSTMQAISGSGYPGVPSLDIIDNILPYIPKEDDKVEQEPLKILDADFPISATCNRVPTIDGHFETLNISLGKKASVDEIKECLNNFAKDEYSNLPTGLAQPIIVHENPFRPQVRLDRDNGKGMAITIGRIRACKTLENGIRMTILGHNTVRGAAGQSILNAEWYVEKAKIKMQKSK